MEGVEPLALGLKEAGRETRVAEEPEAAASAYFTTAMSVRP